MTIFQQKNKNNTKNKQKNNKFLLNKFPEQISTMFLYRLQEGWMAYINTNMCVTSVTSTAMEDESICEHQCISTGFCGPMEGKGYKKSQV